MCGIVAMRPSFRDIVDGVHVMVSEEFEVTEFLVDIRGEGIPRPLTIRAGCTYMPSSSIVKI